MFLRILRVFSRWAAVFCALQICLAATAVASQRLHDETIQIQMPVMETVTNKSTGQSTHMGGTGKFTIYFSKNGTAYVNSVRQEVGKKKSAGGIVIPPNRTTGSYNMLGLYVYRVTISGDIHNFLIKYHIYHKFEKFVTRSTFRLDLSEAPRSCTMEYWDYADIARPDSYLEFGGTSVGVATCRIFRGPHLRP